MGNVHRILLTLSVAVPFCSQGVETIDSNLIIKRHNQIRELIRRGQVPGQPKAVNVANMKWDKYLAQSAEQLAKKCISDSQIPNDPRWTVGQHTFALGLPNKAQKEDWLTAINSWFREHKMYKFSKHISPAARHYTQLVWQNTEYVGCGYAFCKNRHQDQNFYVCNYGPGGNILGQYPYQKA